MPSLKTAYLILAHHQPGHLAKMVRALDTPDCTFFIHIDRKADESTFRICTPERSNVIFLEDRVSVNWGGFSEVEATLALLSAARASGAPFNRYCLLSGSDYPIKGNQIIQHAFSSGREFMRIDRKIDPARDGSHSRNVTHYWFLDAPDPVIRASSGSFRRTPYTGLDLFHGAQWWALTDFCVEYILSFLASNPEFPAFFRHSLCPDEIFFHTIVGNSPFAPRLTHDFGTAADGEAFRMLNEHGCHYIDWNAKEQDKLPKVLDLADLNRLLESRALFARKIEQPRSLALLAALDRARAEDERGLKALE